MKVLANSPNLMQRLVLVRLELTFDEVKKLEI